MLGFNKTTFGLVITVPDDQRKTALEDFKKLNDKMASMVVFLENKDTPKNQKELYEPLYLNLVHTVSQTATILKAMGIAEEEIRKYCKF